MGREVRRVPSDWEHPVSKRTGRYLPLFDDYNKALASFQDDIERDGLALAIDWHGGGPLSDDYMPDWPKDERTHYMMYENTTEGTPISPAMESPEALARWLADNAASAFAGDTATYEQWLVTCQGAFSPSMVIESGSIKSGVEFAAEHEDRGTNHDRR